MEDRVRRLRIGSSFEAFVSRACSRCPIPNIDQETGLSEGSLSTKLLAKRRTGWRIDEDPETDKPKQYFGQNLNHLWTPGELVTVRVGDVVETIEVGQPNLTLKTR